MTKERLVQIEVSVKAWRDLRITQSETGYGAAARDAEELLAYVRELEQGCETCEHQRHGEPHWCNYLYTLARGKYPIYCKDVDNRCGSWAKKGAQP